MRLTRRAALKGVLAATVGAVTGTATYGIGYERHRLGVTEATLPVYIWGQLRFAAKLPSVLALGTLLLVASFILLTIAEVLRRRAERRVRGVAAHA